MVDQRSPTPIQLDGPGPFVTPEVVGCPGLVVAQGAQVSLLILKFRGGKELRVPLGMGMIQRIHDHLKLEIQANPSETKDER